jgi:hypothetical protein
MKDEALVLEKLQDVFWLVKGYLTLNFKRSFRVGPFADVCGPILRPISGFWITELVFVGYSA